MIETNQPYMGNLLSTYDQSTLILSTTLNPNRKI